MAEHPGVPTPHRPADTGGQTHTLGLLYPPADRNRVYTTMQLAFIGGVAEAAASYGYDLLLSPADTDDDPSFRRLVGEGRWPDGPWRTGGEGREEAERPCAGVPRVDGVIVMEVRREDNRVGHLAEAGFPFVAIGRNLRADAAGWVDLDFAGLASACVQHLADLGHRRIAFVNRSERLFYSGYGFARLGDEGYTEAMTKLGLTPRAYLCDDDIVSGQEVVERILRDDPATTSLVTQNEAALEGLYRGLTRHGRSVPRDFSVVGVAIGRNLRADAAGWVDLDFAGLASACVQHLADLGHRRIAFVNRSERLFYSGYGFARLGDEGYTEAMTKLGLTPRAYLCDDDIVSGQEVVERILRDDPATTSLVTQNEAALEGLYRGLTRHGRSVPRDFSVVGVAASPWAEQVSPPLTAADIPAKEMSRVAVDLLVERLRSPGSDPRRVLMKPLIALRASTGRCRPVPGSEPEPEFPDFDLDF